VASAYSAISCTSPRTERRARTTAVDGTSPAQNGTYGVESCAAAAPSTGFMRE